MKKKLALILAIVLFITSVPFVNFAGSELDINNPDNYPIPTRSIRRIDVVYDTSSKDYISCDDVNSKNHSFVFWDASENELWCEKDPKIKEEIDKLLASQYIPEGFSFRKKQISLKNRSRVLSSFSYNLPSAYRGAEMVTTVLIDKKGRIKDIEYVTYERLQNKTLSSNPKIIEDDRREVIDSLLYLYDNYNIM